MEPPKKPTSTKVVYQNPWITIHEDQTITPDGQQGIYAYMESRDSCMIVVENDESKILLVKAYKYPSKSWGWELPGGGSDGEDLITASKRELEEETGIIASTWTKLGEAYVCNGLMTEKLGVFLAQNLSYDGEKEISDEVFEDMKFFSSEEIKDMIKTGQINDCQTLTSLYYHSLDGKMLYI